MFEDVSSKEDSDDSSGEDESISSPRESYVRSADEDEVSNDEVCVSSTDDVSGLELVDSRKSSSASEASNEEVSSGVMLVVLETTGSSELISGESVSLQEIKENKANELNNTTKIFFTNYLLFLER